MAIARKAIAKVFSIVFSSLDETGRSGPCILMPAGPPPSSVICYGFILARDGQDAQRRFPLSPGLSRNGPLAAWSARTCRMLRKRPPRVGARVYDSGVGPDSSLGLPGSTAPTCWCQIRSASFGELRQSRRLSAWPAALLFVEPRPAYIRPRRGGLQRISRTCQNRYNQQNLKGGRFGGEIKKGLSARELQPLCRWLPKDRIALEGYRMADSYTLVCIMGFLRIFLAPTYFF